MRHPESRTILSLKTLFSITTGADRLLFLVLSTISILGIFFMRVLLPEGKTVHIDVNGSTAYVLPLEKDRTISVAGPRGNTIVEIFGRRVRIVDSPCPGKLCVKQGWIQKGSLVCLPNSVTVLVEGSDTSPEEIDAITR